MVLNMSTNHTAVELLITHLFNINLASLSCSPNKAMIASEAAYKKNLGFRHIRRNSFSPQVHLSIQSALCSTLTVICINPPPPATKMGCGSNGLHIILAYRRTSNGTILPFRPYIPTRRQG